MSRKTIFAIILMFGIFLSAVQAQTPGAVTGKTAIDRNLVELFAKTMKLAQEKATSATVALASDSASPEQAASTADALKALAATLNQGNNILNAEKTACSETGMKFEDFSEVRTRLIQVKMLQTLKASQEKLAGKTSGSDMEKEAEANLNKKLEALQEQLKKSQAALEKAKAGEAEYFSRIDSKIVKQKQAVSKLEGDMSKAKNDKQRASKEKSLANAREKLGKLEEERKQPYKAIERASENVLKDEQKVVFFKENMPAALAELKKVSSGIQDFQTKMTEGMDQTMKSAVMQQAELDQAIFSQFPDLQMFLLQPKTN